MIGSTKRSDHVSYHFVFTKAACTDQYRNFWSSKMPWRTPLWIDTNSPFRPENGDWSAVFSHRFVQDISVCHRSYPPSWLKPPFFGVKKTSKCEHSKKQINHTVDRQIKHAVSKHFVSRTCSSPKEKCTSKKCICFDILGPSFFNVFCTICGTVVEENEKHTRSKSGFWDPLAHLEVK